MTQTLDGQPPTPDTGYGRPPKPALPLRVLQITDPHLMADPDGALLGVRTRDSLAAVLAQVRADGRESADLVLATGDLAQDATDEAYRVFAEQMAMFSCSVSWIPGNHDHRERLQKSAEKNGSSQRRFLLGGWQILLLDSSVSGQVHGFLSERELDFLEQSLSEHPSLPTLIALHHHPVSIGTRWMESIGLHNREAFWQVLDRHAQVRCVLWGHIHQELDTRRQQVRLLATPSTCIQFESGARDFSVENKAPGYRWLELYPDGRLETGVRRALDFRFDLDINSGGY